MAEESTNGRVSAYGAAASCVEIDTFEQRCRRVIIRHAGAHVYRPDSLGEEMAAAGAGNAYAGGSGVYSPSVLVVTTNDMPGY